ncbi:MAG: hypothetical protein K0Q52_1138 [Microbacterium sp.]|jgi:hypothetical protein|nr:hypothetical protein [Microbacterium sp.]
MIPTLELAHAQFMARARHEARAESAVEPPAADARRTGDHDLFHQPAD